MSETASKSNRVPARLLFVLGLVWGLFQILSTSGIGFGAGWETVAIAREFARTAIYGNPFHAGVSGPTAVIAPMFPLYLAALIKLLGYTPAFSLTANLASVLAQALHAALLPKVSLVFFGEVRPGIFAGVLSVFAFRLMPQWDAVFTACGILLFLLSANPATWRMSILSGAAAGVLLLTNPATILITGPWMVYLCLQRKASLVRIAGFGAAAFLVALPWMVRNELVLGTFSVKDNFGMTVYASNNDCASSSLAASSASKCYDAMHPNTSERELGILNQSGEARYDSVRTRDTLFWIRAHPGAFVHLTASRILDFWFPPEGNPRYPTFVIGAATVLSIPGFILLFRRRTPVVLYLVAVALIHPLLYYVVVSDVRYRYSLLWLSLLAAGYVLSSGLSATTKRLREYVIANRPLAHRTTVPTTTSSI